MNEKVDIRALLEVAKCPCCDGSGGRYDNYGNAEQCQWCYERSVAISAPGAPADLPECGCCGQTGECDADCDARQAILAAAVVQADPVAWLCLAQKGGMRDQRSLWIDERGADLWFDRMISLGCAVMKTPLYAAPPAHPDAALVEAADAALKAIQDTLEDAYHNAFPKCCGQAAHLECCGSPIQAWDEHDKKIMDRLGPHEKALRAALAGKGATK